MERGELGCSRRQFRRGRRVSPATTFKFRAHCGAPLLLPAEPGSALLLHHEYAGPVRSGRVLLHVVAAVEHDERRIGLDRMGLVRLVWLQLGAALEESNRPIPILREITFRRLAVETDTLQCASRKLGAQTDDLMHAHGQRPALDHDLVEVAEGDPVSAVLLAVSPCAVGHHGVDAEELGRLHAGSEIHVVPHHGVAETGAATHVADDGGAGVQAETGTQLVHNRRPLLPL